MAPEILKIAVTGGAGSGKSSACRLLKGMGFPVVDLDLLAREAVRPGKPAYHAIVADFGPDAVGKNGELDRSWLRERITRDASAKLRLEKAIHPVVYSMLDMEMARHAAAGASMVVVEFPLLFETGRESFFDLVLVVSVPPEVQVARLMKRDGVDEKSAKALIRIQIPLHEKAEKADLVLENSGSLEDMAQCLAGWVTGGELSLKGMKFP
ncbi:dephospho-CoA kinase [Desulfobotulus alkaliphilus]|uniref:Dephospho-CoA kinase n=1 Tax=Desulfobotulus alkaliphilus TaxID=622671 RepID=A0A562S9G6_9BACT|nr:dephospho-CoA kinase [Desulfobotulus alkaliphilus]TWI77434.1 dephospho-CoA kinase [Desulfobotulus alkaliphilus]